MPFLTSRTGSRPVAVTLWRHLHPTTAPRLNRGEPLQCDASAPLLRSNPGSPRNLNAPLHTLSVGARHAVPSFPQNETSGAKSATRPVHALFSPFTLPVTDHT